MTLNEFKAWLEGYEASFPDMDANQPAGTSGSPTSYQWANIKAKLEAVTHGIVSVPQFQHTDVLASEYYKSAKQSAQQQQLNNPQSSLAQGRGGGLGAYAGKTSSIEIPEA